MRERPILFSAPMVRALLAGTKTQTRRVVKHRWPHLWQEPWYTTGRVLTDRPTQDGAWLEFRHRDQDAHGYQGSTASTLVPCPYGAPSDLLWVREAWRAENRQFPAGVPHETLQVGASDSCWQVFNDQGATMEIEIKNQDPMDA